MPKKIDRETAMEQAGNYAKATSPMYAGKDKANLVRALEQHNSKRTEPRSSPNPYEAALRVLSGKK